MCVSEIYLYKQRWTKNSTIKKISLWFATPHWFEIFTGNYIYFHSRDWIDTPKKVILTSLTGLWANLNTAWTGRLGFLIGSNAKQSDKSTNKIKVHLLTNCLSTNLHVLKNTVGGKSVWQSPIVQAVPLRKVRHL